MSPDLRSLGGWLTKDDWPALICPACRAGSLGRPELDVEETAKTKRWHQHENWEPDWIRGYFYGKARCTRQQCEEFVILAGESRVDAVLGDDGKSWYGEYDDFYRLRLAMPPLALTTLPSESPELVQQRIDEMSLVVWSDPHAAANRLRVAAEELLTAQRISRYTRTRKRLTTHARIELLRKKGGKYTKAADALEAVKWMGNQGSHETSLMTADVLDALELFTFAMYNLYDTRSLELEKLARRINKRKRA